MAQKVVKFGGTSMADAAAIEKVAKIVASDPERNYVVVSAPGKRCSGDTKVTDMLYACYHDLEINGECTATFAKIRQRYVEIVKDLGLDFDIEPILDEVEKKMTAAYSVDYCASRGEYLSAIVLAKKLGCEFVDASEIVVFDDNGVFKPEETNERAAKRLSRTPKAVIPGFYGADASGSIHTFSRGGSDITGSIVARAVDASVYENWTDVDGFMSADPRIVESPRIIDKISYKELRELAYMGANVLHPEAIFPVREKNIPINIRNTFNPTAPGTMIVAEVEDNDKQDSYITGVAGKKGYSIIFIEKELMNSELGFARRVLSVLEYYNVLFEHMPSGIGTLSVVVADSELAGKEDVVLERIRNIVKPDTIDIKSGISLISTVGHGISFKPGSAAKLCAALAAEKINIRMIDQGSSELNIIVAVATQDYERAINAIYHAFV